MPQKNNNPSSPAHVARGFTLIELLVVVSIIAILVAMLLPVLTRARDAAKRVACASGMKQFAIAIEMYINDNRGWLPTPLAANGGTTNDLVVDPSNGWSSTASPPQWINYSFPELWNRRYLSSRKIGRCPAFDTAIAESWPDWYAWVNATGYMDGSPPINTRGRMTYLYLPWSNVVYSLVSANWTGIYGQGGINIRTKWSITGPIYTSRNIAILQDTVAQARTPDQAPYTAHGYNLNGNVRPQGGNVLKGDWSVQWVPFGPRWGYVANGYYNYVDLSD